MQHSTSGSRKIFQGKEVHVSEVNNGTEKHYET
jgi:hypothetical protein